MYAIQFVMNMIICNLIKLHIDKNVEEGYCYIVI